MQMTSNDNVQAGETSIDVVLERAKHAYEVHVQHDLEKGDVLFTRVLQLQKQESKTLPLDNTSDPGGL